MKKIKKRKKLISQIKERTEKKRTEKKDGGLLIPSGCSLLDLALSDSIEGGWKTGKVVNLIGDSSSGKSLLALSTLAEMANLNRFKDYSLIFDDIECANEFNLERLFGRQAAQRIEPPRVSPEGDPLYSDMIEDFHYNIRHFLEDDKPFVYILDSFDALDARADADKTDEMLKAHKKGNKTTGTYGLAKPKMASWILRDIKGKLKKTQSLLIVISQTRANLDPFSRSTKTRSGGKALKFYSSHEVWLSIRKTLKSKDLPIGMIAQAKITKNKLTGKSRTVEFPIYYDYGVDNIGAAVDFLVQAKVWTKKKNSVKAVLRNEEFLGSRKSLISYIEKNNFQIELYHLLGNSWTKREKAVKLNRKPKYGD